MSDPFDEMISRLAKKQQEHLEEEIVKAQARAKVNGAGLRVERYYDRSVIVITDTVPEGTVEHIRYREYYDERKHK